MKIRLEPLSESTANTLSESHGGLTRAGQKLHYKPPPSVYLCFVVVVGGGGGGGGGGGVLPLKKLL